MLKIPIFATLRIVRNTGASYKMTTAKSMKSACRSVFKSCSHAVHSKSESDFLEYIAHLPVRHCVGLNGFKL